jgi:hypothetical protein
MHRYVFRWQPCYVRAKNQHFRTLCFLCHDIWWYQLPDMIFSLFPWCLPVPGLSSYCGLSHRSVLWCLMPFLVFLVCSFCLHGQNILIISLVTLLIFFAVLLIFCFCAFKKIQCFVFRYCLCFCVVYHVSWEEICIWQKLCLDIPALHWCNFGVCLLQLLKLRLLIFWFH